MAGLCRSLLLLFAGSSQKDLAKQVRYLKEENEILRAKLPAKITVTRPERERLLKFGSPLGASLKKLISIVHPDTFLRWQREQRRSRGKVKIRNRGRPRTPEQLCKLVLKLARENGWGYTRILGELKKLAVTCVSRSTIRNLLREHGLDPGPRRGAGTWDEFIRRHAETLWQCDLISKRAITPRGVKELFLLVFLHVGTRRVWVSPALPRPNETWMRGQVSAFLEHASRAGSRVERLLHDRDAKFTAAVDADLRAAQIKVHRIPPRSPNLLAYVERFNLSIQGECLDHFVVFGERHLNYLVAEWLEHYHYERPHQGKENELLCVPAAESASSGAAVAEFVRIRAAGTEETDGDVPPSAIKLSDIRCRQRLGGLLKHYHRHAA